MNLLRKLTVPALLVLALTLMPMASESIFGIPIGAGQVTFDSSEVIPASNLDAFVPTGSASGICLVTLSESNAFFVGPSPAIYCSTNCCTTSATRWFGSRESAGSTLASTVFWRSYLTTRLARWCSRTLAYRTTSVTPVRSQLAQGSVPCRPVSSRPVSQGFAAAPTAPGQPNARGRAVFALRSSSYVDRG